VITFDATVAVTVLFGLALLTLLIAEANCEAAVAVVSLAVSTYEADSELAPGGVHVKVGVSPLFAVPAIVIVLVAAGWTFRKEVRNGTR
jgi:hypothetical protein